ncbi:high affinity nerve growth factor receptor-like isoform X1 [Ptychodera flava]|uniref:high affinity nerve growth factor receptor-like isoform X1 n=1 Tax=Ptychodera flava TaxID=63121 RepID=UPI00396A07D1
MGLFNALGTITLVYASITALLLADPASSTWCGSLPSGCICDDSQAVICRDSFTSIPSGLPSQIHQLVLQGNQIKEIEVGDLSALTQLISLDLSSNEINRIDNGVFASLQNLESLYLERNNINWLDRGAFKGLTRLRHLYLDHNSVSFLPIGLFSQLPYLHELRLNNNRLHDVARHTADELSRTAVKLISLDHNPLQCNCDLLQFVDWLKGTDDVLLLKQATVKCTNQDDVRRAVTELTKHDVRCAPSIKPEILLIETRSCDSVRLHWSYSTLGLFHEGKVPPTSMAYAGESRSVPEFNIMIKTVDSRESSPLPRVTMETSSTATIEGLRALDEYQFTIQALNEVGRGPFSEEHNYRISSYKLDGKIISCLTREEETGSMDSNPAGSGGKGHDKGSKNHGRSDDSSQSSLLIIIISSAVGAIVMIAAIVTLLCKVWLPRRDILAPFQAVKFSKFIPVPKNRDPEIASSSVDSVCKYNYPKPSEDVPAVRILTEVPRKKVKFVRNLHAGGFGRLYLAGLESLFPGHPPAIAMVKELQLDATEHARQSFDGQVSAMCEFEHPNVLEMLGVITIGQPLSIIFEYAEYGDLKQFLAARSPSAEKGATKLQPPSQIHRNKLVDIATQVACAMSYLASNDFVHRDLATRNCMVTGDLSIKVADLGIASELYPQDYTKIGRKMLPIRWMAPETLEKMVYTTESDVWSYGVTLWEIFSYGALPYSHLDDEQVVDVVLKGTNLQAPADFPSKVLDVMLSCWKLDPNERATFNKIHSSLSNCCLTPSHSAIPVVPK